MENVAIIYPNRRKVGEKALSIYFLRDELMRMGLRSRFYFLDSTELSELKKHDMILISCHYENDYLHLIEILEKAGFSLGKSTENNEKQPFIIMGGPVVVNPAPLSSIIDAFFIGDGEIFFDEMKNYGVEQVIERSEHVWKKGKEKVKVALCKLLGDRHPAESGSDEEFFLEVQRGCRNKCKFCLIGWTRGTCRYRTLDNVKLIMSRVPKNRYRKIMLVGSDIFSHPELPEIYRYLRSRKFDVATPSFHVRDVLEFRDFLKEVKPRILTIAPETTERLRNLVGKNFSDDDVLQAVKMAKKNGVRTVKLYFMVGIPYEREEDIRDVVKLVKDCTSIKGIYIKCTFSIFVPKPHTPFQFAPVDEIESLSRKNMTIARSLRKMGVMVHLTNPKRAHLQAILSIGDEKIGELLLKAHKYGMNYSAWKKVASKEGIVLDSYLEEKDLSHRFGFENVDTGVSKQALYTAYKKYVDEALS